MPVEESIEDHNRKFLEDLDNDKDHIKIYVSCPITNDKDNYDKNFKIAVKAVESKTEEGHHIYRAVNPLDLKVGYSDDTKWTAKTWIECMKKDLDLLTHCDAMVLCPGWEVSAGCITEAIAARKIGIHVMTMHEPFGVFPDDKAFEDNGFPTYQMRDTWRKINEIKNLVSEQMAWAGFRRKAEKTLNKYEKPEKEIERRYVIRGDTEKNVNIKPVYVAATNDTPHEDPYEFTSSLENAKNYEANEAIQALNKLVDFQKTDSYGFLSYKFSIVPAPEKEVNAHVTGSVEWSDDNDKAEGEDLPEYHIVGYFREEDGNDNDMYSKSYLMHFSEPASVDTKKTRSLDPDYTFSPDVEDAKTFTKEEAKHIVDVIEKYFKKVDIDAYLKMQKVEENASV